MSPEITVGPTDLLKSAPTVVTVEGTRFVLSTDDEDEPVLFSAVCPHQNGRVSVAEGTTLRCPNHRWKFDAQTGTCISGGDSALTAYPVRRVDGELLATVE